MTCLPTVLDHWQVPLVDSLCLYVQIMMILEEISDFLNNNNDIRDNIDQELDTHYLVPSDDMIIRESL